MKNENNYLSADRSSCFFMLGNDEQLSQCYEKRKEKG
jgi:hypothetical protein